MVTIGRTQCFPSGTYDISFETEASNGHYRGVVHLVFDFADNDCLNNVIIEDTDIETLDVEVETIEESSCVLNLIASSSADAEEPSCAITLTGISKKGREITENISIPLAFLLARLHEIFSGTFSENSIQLIHSQYEQSRPMQSLFSFQRDCQDILSFEDRLTVMDILAGYNQAYRMELAENCNKFFKNMLLHEKSYHINSREEFERWAELHGSKKNLVEIDRTKVEELYITEWSENPNTVPTNPEMFGFSQSPVFSTVTRSSFLQYAAEYVLNEDVEAVRDRLTPQESAYAEEEYLKQKDTAQTGPPVKRANQWEDLLPEAAYRGHYEFEFALSNFLYWQVIHRRDLNINLEIDLLQSSAKLFYHLNLHILRQRANCYQHIKLAHKHRFNQEYTQALIEAGHAIDIAENKNGSWETTLSRMSARARRDYALLHRNILMKNGEITGAIAAVARAIQKISSMDLPERFQMKLLHHLAANRHDSLASKAENEDDLITAKSHLEQAFYHFDRCYRSNRKAYINYKLEQLIDQIQVAESREAFRERERRVIAPGEEEEARDPGFRKKIVSAYNGACAFCGARRESPKGQFEVHAAHIRPVSDNGPDLVQNGLALCRLHHWAFDNGWMTLTDDLTIEVINRPDAAGYEEFAGLNGRDINSPDEEYKKPGSDFVAYHRRNHGFEVTEPDIDPYNLTEEELDDATSNDMDATTDQKIEEYLARASSIFSESEIRGSMNYLITNRSL